MQRRRAQGVEALLDDRRPDALAARVVSVVDREQRLERGHRGGRQRPLREVANAGDIRRRQVAAHLGRHVAIGMLEEDGGPIALEQDHRVVDQAGQDPVEVEPAADVGRHAAKCLGSMEQVGDLVGALGAADHRPESRPPRPGRRRGRADRVSRAASPTTWRTPHGSRGPGIATASSGRSSGKTASGSFVPAIEQDAGHRTANGPIPAGGQFERLAEDPESTGQIDEAGRSGVSAPATARGASRSPRASQATTR